MYCTNCGSKFEGKFCPACGTPAYSAEETVKLIKPEEKTEELIDEVKDEVLDGVQNINEELNEAPEVLDEDIENKPDENEDKTVMLPMENEYESVTEEPEMNYGEEKNEQSELNTDEQDPYYPPQQIYSEPQPATQGEASAVWIPPIENDKSGSGKKIAIAVCAVVLVVAAAIAAYFLRPIPVKSIEFTQKQAVIDIEDTYKIGYSVQPENNKEEGLKWTSSDENIATVTDGLITAKGKGECVITASSEKGVTESFNLTVEIQPKEIKLSNTVVNITIGKSFQLTAEVLPNGVNDNSVKWESSDSGIATVDKNGLVKAVAVGNCVVSASSVNGVETKCSITVTKPYEETLILGAWSAYYIEDALDKGYSYPYQEGDGAVFNEDKTCTITFFGNSYKGKWSFVKIDSDGDYEYNVAYDDGVKAKVYVFQDKSTRYYGDMSIVDGAVRMFCETDSSIST